MTDEWTMANGAEHDEHRVTAPAFWTVTVYECDRCYGGPEEGGWWYNVGIRQDGVVPRIFTDIDAAYICAEQMQRDLDRVANRDGRNRDLSSVNCVGRYCAEVHEGYPPQTYPEQTPHYE